MFGNSKRESDKTREAISSAIKDICRFLASGGQVAIYDTKNNSKEERKKAVEAIREQYSTYPEAQKQSFTVMFIEAFCEDMDRVDKHFLETNTYKYTNKENETEQLDDFHEYLHQTDSAYETLNPSDPELKETSFIKVIDFGETMITHKVQGYIESKLASFCVNVHTETRYVILARHGEAEDNASERLGGDTPLNGKGERFAQELAKYMLKLFPVEFDEKNGGSLFPRNKKRRFSKKMGGNSKEPRLGVNPQQIASCDDLVVYTSHMKRAFGSARYITCGKFLVWKSLTDIDCGICQGMLKSDFKIQMFGEYTARQRDKLNYRYPQGESYVDIKKRLEPVIFEIERERRNIMIVCHRAVLRCLYAYFVDIEEQEIPFLPFPRHTVVALKASLGGSHGWVVKEARIVLDPGLEPAKDA